MSNAFATDLRLEPTPSTSLAQLLFISHSAAIAVVWLLPLAAWIGIGLTALVILGWGHALMLHVWRLSGSAVIQVLSRADGGWELGLRDGRHEPARLLGSSFVHPRLVILNFAVSGWRRRHVVLPWDSVDEDALRRLRVRLRMGRPG